MKTSKEFVVGKHNIGWISSNFAAKVGISEFTLPKTPARVTTLTRDMSDTEIEKEITKGQYATLGDVLALLDSDEVTFKDGYWNLFHLPSCVVRVYWSSGYRKWRVRTWYRGDDAWDAGARVLSPATDASALETGPSDTLTLEDRVRALEEWRDRVQQQ
jgi:hypothetical protein